LFEQADRVEYVWSSIGVHIDHLRMTAIDTPMPETGHSRTLVPSQVVV
jgi:hypothetical protein